MPQSSANLTSVKPTHVDGKYVTKDLILTSHSILKKDVSSNPTFRFKASNDRDISTSFGGKSGYIRECYLKYENGEISTSVPIHDCIIEYRENVGSKKVFNKGGRKRDGAYLASYVSVGIPEEVFNSLVTSLNKEVREGVWDKGESFGTIKDGYVWETLKLPSTANDTKKLKFLKCLVVTDSPKPMYTDAVGIMRDSHKSLLGVAMISFRLRKISDTPRACRAMQYQLGGTLTSFQLVDFTSLRGPGITQSMQTVAFSAIKASSELTELVNKLELEEREEGLEEEEEDEDDASEGSVESDDQKDND